MRTYGIRKPDRIKCFKKNCGCGDMSSKHPKDCISNSNMNRRLKKHARQQQRKECVSE